MKCFTMITVLLLIWSACLQGSPVKELSIWFARLNNINCKEAVLLHTPVKAEERCFRDALECFMEGLSSLMLPDNACSEDLEQGCGWDTIENIYQFLNHTAEGMKMKKPTGRCACTANPKMPFQDFRKELIRLGQQVNSQK